MHALADIIGAVAILIAIGTVIANLTFGDTYDLDTRTPAAKMPKDNQSTQARK